MADLHRRGIHLRKPPIFRRVGIPGSGGPDWWRNDYEFCVCVTKGGKLPWSDNTATGHRPKWAPGGEMSNRLSNGARVNQWGHSIDSGATVTDPGGVVRSKGRRPSHKLAVRDGHGFTPGRVEPSETQRKNGEKSRTIFREDSEGNVKGGHDRDICKKANPGNVIADHYTAQQVADLLAARDGDCGDVLDCVVGGGVMGHKLAHESEAPFPESLVEPFVRSFCPPGGIVLDPFCGSGTTLAVAAKHGRSAIGIDCRSDKSGCDTARRRLDDAIQKRRELLASLEATNLLFGVAF